MHHKNRIQLFCSARLLALLIRRSSRGGLAEATLKGLDYERQFISLYKFIKN
jgi:hypothetical protein